MLLGEFRHVVDAKGRCFVPAQWREELGEKVVITRGLDGCLYLMSEDAFVTFKARFGDLSMEKPEARGYSRVFFAKAAPGQVDAQGRVFIPANLRDAAGITKDVVLAGQDSRGEIWDREAYDTYMSSVLGQYEEIAQKLAT